MLCLRRASLWLSACTWIEDASGGGGTALTPHAGICESDSSPIGCSVIHLLLEAFNNYSKRPGVPTRFGPDPDGFCAVLVVCAHPFRTVLLYVCVCLCGEVAFGPAYCLCKAG